MSSHVFIQRVVKIMPGEKELKQYTEHLVQRWTERYIAQTQKEEASQ